MADIITLTINPSLDVSTSAERVVPFHKLRAAPRDAIPAGAASTWHAW